MKLENKLNNRNFRYIVLALFLAASLVACGGAIKEPPALNVTLNALDIKWDTTNIDAVVGQTITITLVNTGVLDHNLVIEELGIDVSISPGATEVITFVVTEPGTLDFICNEPGHFEAGMAGTITVSE